MYLSRCSRALLCLGLLALSAACTGAPAAPASATAKVYVGRVTDDANQSVAGMRVRVVGSAMSTVTDADGAFRFEVKSDAPEQLMVTTEPDKYSQVSRTVRGFQQETATTVLVVKPYDTVQTIMLPQGNQAAVEVVVNNAYGPASFIIPPGAIVRPDGTPAVGQAEVRISYWSPNDNRVDAPAALVGVGQDGNAAPLVTYGMMEGRIFQKDTELQLAPGQMLQAAMPAGPEVLALAAQPDAKLPDSYFVDPNTGLFTFAGLVERPDPSATKAAPSVGKRNNKSNDFTVRMDNGKFLTLVGLRFQWNIDHGLTLLSGGCVRGYTVDACTGKRVNDVDFSFYFLGVEQVAAFNIKTNGDGAFCRQIPFGRNNDTSRKSGVKYIVSATNDFTKTAYCNPAAKLSQCFGPPQADSGSGTNSTVSDCRLGDLLQSRNGVQYEDTCKPHAATLLLEACTFCSGTLLPDNAKCDIDTPQKKIYRGDEYCYQLDAVKVPTATCKCDRFGKCTSTKPPFVCKEDHTEGSQCFVDPKNKQNANPDLACCSTRKEFPLGTFTCADDICIRKAAL